MAFPVIPAKAGIQEKRGLLDPGFRRGDGLGDFLGTHQIRQPYKNGVSIQYNDIQLARIKSCLFPRFCIARRGDLGVLR
jgi:hypothetical protein